MTRRPLRRILLVEDDTDIQDVTTLLLSESGEFEVRACGSAVEGLETARFFNPDLILLDVMMPGLDGQGALAAFRKMPATADTPVIFVTARVQPFEILEYRQLGSLGVIPKPFDPETLARTIQGMWDRNEEARLKEALREDLAALRRNYASEFPGRLRALQEAAASLREHGWDSRVADSIYEMAHRLAGSAAIYGYPAVSEASRRVCALASQHGSGSWVRVDPQPLLKLVAALSTVIQQSTAPPEIHVQAV